MADVNFSCFDVCLRCALGIDAQAADVNSGNDASETAPIALGLLLLDVVVVWGMFLEICPG